ncbi:MAG: helix-turn-helix domain-containing protein [Candidatus Electrothrix sp. YB6]
MNSQETNQPEKKNEGQKKQQPEKEQKSGKLPVGKMLRQVREKKGLTIGDISLETNISSSNLVSIELGNYNALPADTFVRGQLAIYAAFLGLDGPETARLFFEERDLLHSTGRAKNGVNPHELSARQLAEPSYVSSATWGASLLLIIIAFLVGFCWYTGWNPFSYFLQEKEASDSPPVVEQTVEQAATGSRESENQEISAANTLPLPEFRVEVSTSQQQSEEDTADTAAEQQSTDTD